MGEHVLEVAENLKTTKMTTMTTTHGRQGNWVKIIAFVRVLALLFDGRVSEYLHGLRSRGRHGRLLPVELRRLQHSRSSSVGCTCHRQQIRCVWKEGLWPIYLWVGGDHRCSQAAPVTGRLLLLLLLLLLFGHRHAGEGRQGRLS